MWEGGVFGRGDLVHHLKPMSNFKIGVLWVAHHGSLAKFEGLSLAPGRIQTHNSLTSGSRTVQALWQPLL